LEDLNYADDLALLSHSFSLLMEKIQLLKATAASDGLRKKMNEDKTKICK